MRSIKRIPCNLTSLISVFALTPVLVLVTGCLGQITFFHAPKPPDPVVLSGTITRDTSLSGKIILAGDLLIPVGITLALGPGTDVTVLPSKGTRTDSQFITTETEILVKGSLEIKDTSLSTEEPEPGLWGGIIVNSPGAKVLLERAVLKGAEYGVLALAGRVRVKDTVFERNEVGLAAAKEVILTVETNTYRGNGIATAAWHSPKPIRSTGDIFEGNENNALALVREPENITHREISPVVPPPPPVTREYIGEAALDADTSWAGTVVIDGQVTVPENITLTIKPGTRVLFSFRDTNRDGMGESWILVRGTIRILGDEDAWVLFDAEGRSAPRGAWDSLSIIASDSPDNLVRHTIFRKGVKAFHNHFSGARLEHVVFEENLRGMQFQESEGTTISWALFRNNQSGARFRDSTVSLSNIVARDNVAAINFFRSKVIASDLLVTGSFAESFVSRESETDLIRAVITGNVQGPRFKGEGELTTVRECFVCGNLTEGISFLNVRGTVKNSDLSNNGFSGLSVTDARISVSSSRLSGNGTFEINNNGPASVDAWGNDWGGDPASLPDRIYDGQDEAGIGTVHTGFPVNFSLAFPGTPLPSILYDRDLLVVGDVTFPESGELLIVGKSRVLFSGVPEDSLFDLGSKHPSFPSSELIVRGAINAGGSIQTPIQFAPLTPGTSWGALNLNGSKGGCICRAVFRGALTGLHARDCGTLLVRSTLFEDNEAGVRFSLCDITVEGNTFRGNRAGLRFHDATGIVKENTFEENGSAIFITDKPRDVILRDNIFLSSSDYHIKLGIGVTGDVTIQGGEFTVPERKTEGDMIFDGEDDPDLGKVLLIP